MTSVRPPQTSSFEKLNTKEGSDLVDRPRPKISQGQSCRRSIFPCYWNKSVTSSGNLLQDVSSSHGMENASLKQKVRFHPMTTVITVIEINPYQGQDCKEEDEDLRWYSEEDLNKFKNDAFHTVRQIQTQHNLVPFLSHDKRRQAFFSNPALKVSDDDICCSQGTRDFENLIFEQVKNILVVDPNMTFMGLYIRSFKLMFPHCSVMTSNNSSDALNIFTERRQINETGKGGKTNQGQFDIVVVEERLRDHDTKRRRGQYTDSDSGANLLKAMNGILAEDGKGNEASNDDESRYYKRSPLFIGTSSFLGEDGVSLVRGGADHIWGKPPPSFDNYFRNELLNALLIKRGHPIVCL